MKKIKKLAVTAAKQFVGLFPHNLPTGEEEFGRFCDTIFATYNLPDMKSYREYVATMIMHLPPTCHKSKLLYFGKSIKKAQANQSAYNMIQKFKEQDKPVLEVVESKE